MRRSQPRPASRQWAIVPQPKLPVDNFLSGVAAVNKRLAWAAGSEGYNKLGRGGRALIEQWNGKTWRVDRLPSSPATAFGYVAASSASSAWAVGWGGSGAAVLLHWNGHGWHRATLPGAPANARVIGLTASAGGPAWLLIQTGSSALIYEWTGRVWADRPYACTAYLCKLSQISARTGSDAWVVGNYINGSGSGGPLALHWNGQYWQATKVPYVKYGYLIGAFAVSGKNAWAYGQVFQTTRMLMYRWNGSAWRKAGVPAGLTAPGLGNPTGITGDSSGDLWIYGFGNTVANTAGYLRYHRSRWALLGGAAIPGQVQVYVHQVMPIPGTPSAWSVGIGLTTHLRGRARIEAFGNPAG